MLYILNKVPWDAFGSQDEPLWRACLSQEQYHSSQGAMAMASSSDEDEADYSGRYGYTPINSQPLGFRWGVDEDTTELQWSRWESDQESEEDDEEEIVLAAVPGSGHLRDFWLREDSGDEEMMIPGERHGGTTQQDAQQEDELPEELSFLQEILSGGGGSGVENGIRAAWLPDLENDDAMVGGAQGLQVDVIAKTREDDDSETPPLEAHHAAVASAVAADVGRQIDRHVAELPVDDLERERDWEIAAGHLWQESFVVESGHLEEDKDTAGSNRPHTVPGVVGTELESGLNDRVARQVRRFRFDFGKASAALGMSLESCRLAWAAHDREEQRGRAMRRWALHCVDGRKPT